MKEVKKLKVNYYQSLRVYNWSWKRDAQNNSNHFKEKTCFLVFILIYLNYAKLDEINMHFYICRSMLPMKYGTNCIHKFLTEANCLLAAIVKKFECSFQFLPSNFFSSI